MLTLECRTGSSLPYIGPHHLQAFLIPRTFSIFSHDHYLQRQRGKGDSDRAEEVAGSVRLLSAASSQYACVVSAPRSLGSPDAMDFVSSLPYLRCFGLHKCCLRKSKTLALTSFWRPLRLSGAKSML